MIKGITVLLTVRVQSGTDDFNRPTYTETVTSVDNVLVGPAGTEAVVNDLQLYGKHLAYELYIPKGNENDWTDTTVQFLGQTFRTYGIPEQCIGDNVPLGWNKKVKVERYG